MKLRFLNGKWIKPTALLKFLKGSLEKTILTGYLGGRVLISLDLSIHLSP